MPARKAAEFNEQMERLASTGEITAALTRAGTGETASRLPVQMAAVLARRRFLMAAHRAGRIMYRASQGRKRN